MDRIPIPRKIRDTVLKRANGRCEDCCVENNHLELHHLTYIKLIGGRVDWQEPIFGLEEEDDLLALCRECHLKKHIRIDGSFERDPEEVQNEKWWFNELLAKE